MDRHLSHFEGHPTARLNSAAKDISNGELVVVWWA